MVYREDAVARVVLARSFVRARGRLPFRGADDVLRAIELDDGWIVAVGNAADHGFATCFPAGSRLLLDAFVRSLDSTAGLDAAERAREAFSAAARAFLERAPALPERDPELVDAPVTASLTVALVRPTEVRCFHRGGQSVVLAASTGVRRRLEPHDLAAKLRAHQLEPAPPSTPDVLADVIGPEDWRPEETVWWADPPASVWVLSRAARDVRGDELCRADWPTEPEVDALLARRGDPYVAGARLDIRPGLGG